jgi:hypothetical protein
MLTYLLSQETFVAMANGRARTRCFSDTDYARYRRAYEQALLAADRQDPFYAWDHAGAVANKYGWRTSTARWGVWTTNAGQVVQVADRVPIHGRHVPQAYCGGIRQYLADFRRGDCHLAPPRDLPALQEDLPETCSACQTPLDGVYYTGQRWGETLCLPCFDARVAAGLAKPALVPA